MSRMYERTVQMTLSPNLLGAIMLAIPALGYLQDGEIGRAGEAVTLAEKFGIDFDQAAIDTLIYADSVRDNPYYSHLFCDPR